VTTAVSFCKVLKISVSWLNRLLKVDCCSAVSMVLFSKTSSDYLGVGHLASHPHDAVEVGDQHHLHSGNGRRCLQSLGPFQIGNGGDRR
jgi:hypothetical protein